MDQTDKARELPDDNRSRTPGASSEEIRIPVIQEELKIDTRQVETGKVRVSKTIREKEETVQMPVVSEYVDVTRVPVNRPVDAAPPIRYEGDTTIIPVLKEVLVVEKRLVLVEEVHLRRHRTETTVSQQVTLRTEEVRIEGTTHIQKDSDPQA